MSEVVSGWWDTSYEYQAKKSIIMSISHKGTPADNARIEWFNYDNITQNLAKLHANYVPKKRMGQEFDGDS